MTVRDVIMDKYWLEFLEVNYDYLYSHHGMRLDSSFWQWFYKVKVPALNSDSTKLEDYLK